MPRINLQTYHNGHTVSLITALMLNIVNSVGFSFNLSALPSAWYSNVALLSTIDVGVDAFVITKSQQRWIQ